MKPILNIKAEILSTNVVHVRFQKQLFCFRFCVVVSITKRSLFKKMKMLTSLHVDYIQHHKFNHQEKIWIIFEVCCPEKLLLKYYETDIKHKGRDPFYKCSAEVCEQHVLSGDYWLVKKALVVLVFFDGLRHCESMNLVQERFSSINDSVGLLYTYCT